METKRLALVYSGQPRNLKECWENHHATLIEANPDWRADIFAHLWFDESWERETDWNRKGYGKSARVKSESRIAREILHRQKALESAKVSGALDADIKEFIAENWQPKAIRFETPRSFDYREFTSLGGANPIMASNGLSMFYSMEQANNLKREYERAHGFQYDCVIRMRTDILFLEPAAPGALENYDLKKMNLREVHRAGHAINDMFAFADSAAMDKITSVFSNIGKCAGAEFAAADGIFLGKENILDGQEIFGYHAAVVQGLQIAQHRILLELYRHRHFGHIFSDTPEGKEPHLQLRMKTLRNLLGAPEAERLRNAARMHSGLLSGGEKVSLAELHALRRAYMRLPHEQYSPVKIKWQIKNDLQSLVHRPLRGYVPPHYLWHYYRYKLKSLLRSKN